MHTADGTKIKPKSTLYGWIFIYKDTKFIYMDTFEFCQLIFIMLYCIIILCNYIERRNPNMKKIISILLTLAMLMSVVGVCAAEPASKVLESTNIVNVTGFVDSGETVNILLKDGEDVKYINEFDVEKDGSYRAKFMYEGDIAGVSLAVKQGNADVTDSVVEAISEKEAVSYELNVVNSNKTYITAEIENYFNVAGKTYTVLLAYYGENNKLLDVFVKAEETVVNDQTIYEKDYDIPAGTEKIKVFMWDSVKTMIPLAKEVTGKKNDTIRILTIGNSFADDPTAYLAGIAALDGIEMIIHSANIGGGGFGHHWTAWSATNDADRRKYVGGTKTIDDFLDYNTYDFITVQQVSQNSGKYETYTDGYADKMLKYLREKQPTAEIVLQATWAYEKGSTHFGFANYNKNQETMHNAIVDAVTKYCDYAKDLKTDSGKSISLDGKPLRYIPTGTAFMNARANPMFDTEYIHKDSTLPVDENPRVDTTVVRTLHRDSYHCSFNYGRYLAALTWYACLTGNSVLDNTYTNTSHPIPEDARPVINKAANDAAKSVGFWN